MSRGAFVLSMVLHLGLCCLVGKWLPADGERGGVGEPGRRVFVLDELPGARFVAAADPAVEPLPDETRLEPESTLATPLPAGVITTSGSVTPVILADAAPADPASAATSLSAPERPSRLPRRSRASSGGESGRQRDGPSADAGNSGDGHDPGFSPPQFRVRYRPRYPAEARAQRLEGVVLLRVEVDADGRVANASVQQGSGYPVLDRAALAAVRSWRFDPARRDGVPVAAWVDVPVRFRFESDDPTRT